MRQSLTLVASALFLAFASSNANAITITDPVGDFVSTYTGPHQADLDVTSFSVTYDSGLSAFMLKSTMAGMIDSGLPGFYAIGVNTGTGPSNFASILHPGVTFNQVISVQKTGAARVGTNNFTATIAGDTLSLTVPLAFLPSTGFAPERYAFNIWPRSGTTGGTAVISDFSPDNSTLSTLGVTVAAPEPATWATMVIGFGLCGAALRTSRRARALTA